MPYKVTLPLVLLLVTLTGHVRAESSGPPLLPDTSINETNQPIKSMKDVPTSAVPHIHDRFDLDIEEVEALRPLHMIDIPPTAPENIVGGRSYSIAPLTPLMPVRIGVTPSVVPSAVADRTDIKVSKAVIENNAPSLVAKGKNIEKKKSKAPQSETPQAARMGIMAAVQSTHNLKKLAKLLRTVGLKPMFDAKGKYTLFAPSDAAFDRVSDKYLAELERPENHGLLLRILGNHIIGGHKISEEQLAEMRKSPVTMAAQLLTITNVDITIQVNRANILVNPILCSNGIIYIIDQVLLPTSPCSVGDRQECP